MILNLNNYDIFPYYDHDFYIILNYLFGYVHDLSPLCKISGYIIYGSVFSCILGDALGRVWALELLGLDYWTVELRQDSLYHPIPFSGLCIVGDSYTQ